MQRLLKYIGYLALFSVSFLIFLYWVFPYENLKERFISGIERQLGGAVEVSAGELEPYWFTGMQIDDLAFNTRNEEGATLPALKLERLRVRAALFSLLIGSPRVSYMIEAENGEIEGGARQTGEGIAFDAGFDKFGVSAVEYLSSQYGIKLSGEIDGNISMELDQRRPARSSGTIEVDLIDFKLAESQAQLGPMEVPLPALVLTKDSGSGIALEVGKGALVIETFKLTGGDLGLDVSGKIFLSNTLPNSRFNLKGSFTVSETLEQALPFLFIVEKQKRPDGSYPITVTGRLSSPVIKVGTFTLPL